MNLLETFFIIAGVVIFILAFDIARRQRFNALHFIIFIFIGAGLLIFTLFPSSLNAVGRLFGLQRGADLLVYSSILFLIYISLLLLRKVEENKTDITRLVREIAIANSPKKRLTGDIVFLVRAYNEQEVIKPTIQAMIDAGYTNIVLINDGSSDATEERALEFGDTITYLKHYKNRGAGAAMETGFEYVRRYSDCDMVCTFDADGQHDIEDIEKFIAILKSDHSTQVVFGSRFVEKTNTNIPLTRKIILKLGIVFTFFLSHIALTDAHNGYRVFRKEAVKKIHLTINGMGYASELIDIISTLRIPFKEVPVNIRYTEYSLSKGQKSSNAFNIFLHIIWNKFFK